MRTMEEGSSLEGAQVETAQEALDATMKLDEPDGSEVESNFAQLKAELTGVVKQVKDTIEEKLSKRRRLTPPRPADQEDVEIVEPGDKRTSGFQLASCLRVSDIEASSVCSPTESRAMRGSRDRFCQLAF